MRVSTSYHQQLGLTQILNQQSKLSDTQLKLASGKKYLTPSENPQAAASLNDFNHRIKVYEQYQDNVGVVRQRLEHENSAVDSSIEIIQKVRELAVQGLNDVNQGINRNQIAIEIIQLNKSLVDVANTQNPNGEYLFSGYASDEPPFDNSYSYQGDDVRSLDIGSSRSMADGDKGDEVFGDYDATAVVGSFDSVFQAIDQLVADLQANDPKSASLKDLDRALERFSNTQVSIGARLNTLEEQENLNDQYILDHKAIVSDLGDLDYAKAISDFNLQQTALQAAQQSFAKVKDLSLFNYL